MATRLAVPDASVQEQIRDLAAAIADLHYVIGIVVENAKEFIPGESVEELVTSWERSNESFGALVNSLVSLTGKQSRGRIPEAPKLSVTQLRENDLLGETGRAKRSTLSRLRDRLMMFWNSHPITDEKREKATEAAIQYFEYGASVLGSIPFGELGEEFCLLMKQLITLRAKRGV